MKSLLIGGIVGLIFMAGGFWYGMSVAPMPTGPEVKPGTPSSTTTPTVAPEAITTDSLRKASQDISDLNKSLQEREKAVAARELQVKQREDELTAERDALNRSHEQFNTLYSQFQQRLQLVETNELDQLHRQIDLYTSMDPVQAIDLIRAQNDSRVIRLFSLIEVKELGKLVGQWKAKYPDDVPRVLRVLDGMGRVMTKDQVALPATTTATAGNPTPAPATPADNSTAANTTPATTTQPDNTAAPISPADASPTAPGASADGSSTPSASGGSTPTPTDTSTPTPPPATN